jgi:alpha-tubulin suppressor-like RCC1 family protein
LRDSGDRCGHCGDSHVADVSVTPNAASIFVGETQSFTATGTFSNGSTRALGPAISSMAPGYRSSCALLASGGVECWGYNRYGELGDGNTANSLIARPVVGISTATAVALREEHGCALLLGGAVRCWGLNSYGELGDGTTNAATSPVAVSGIGVASAVGLGVGHSCALLASGAVQCWGWNSYGQLGNGSPKRSCDGSAAVRIQPGASGQIEEPV